jgi:hypothetical protein
MGVLSQPRKWVWILNEYPEIVRSKICNHRCIFWSNVR